MFSIRFASKVASGLIRLNEPGDVLKMTREELPDQQTSDVRHLPQTVNFFLRKMLPDFSVDTCSEAFILTLRNFVSFDHFHGYLWRPAQHGNQRVQISLAGNVVSFAEETISPAPQSRQNDASSESRDDLRVTLHRSIKSLDSEPEFRRTLESAGCKAAIEIFFAYYGRPVLWIVLGLPGPKQFPAEETQELLLVFCKCALVSLHGAYLAELDQRDGKRDKPEPSERFDLALRWFHTVVRHLNVGIVRLQNNQANDAEDALQRASIVAGVCLAELLTLMRIMKNP
jgi:hypothetical protein